MNYVLIMHYTPKFTMINRFKHIYKLLRLFCDSSNSSIYVILLFMQLFTSDITAQTKILIFGDIYPGGRVQTNFLLKKETCDPVLKSLIAQADVVIGNFECTATYQHNGADKMYILRLLPDFPSHTELFGLHAVTVANNHILDYGEKGMYDTFDYLQRLNIAYAGAGNNLAQAMKPAVITAKNGTVVRLFGFSAITPSFFAAENKSGTCPADPAIVRAALAPYRSSNGINVVYFHFGSEYNPIVTESQKMLARIALENGAHIVVGAHTHVMQTWEMISGKPVFYGLGNTLFDIDQRQSTKTGLVPFITVNADGAMTVEVFTIRSEPDKYMPYVVK